MVSADTLVSIEGRGENECARPKVRFVHSGKVGSFTCKLDYINVAEKLRVRYPLYHGTTVLLWTVYCRINKRITRGPSADDWNDNTTFFRCYISRHFSLLKKTRHVKKKEAPGWSTEGFEPRMHLG